MQVINNKRKPYVENDNAVQVLINRERNLHQLDVLLPVEVQLSSDGKKTQIVHNGVTLTGEIKRPLIHQLGGRAWGQDKDFESISQIWQQKFVKNRYELEQELANMFKKHELSIRYETDTQGKNNIYGVVTPHFIDVNQLEFRERFIEHSRQSTSLIPESQGIEIGPFGEIIEFFKFDSTGFQTQYEYGLVYARNNGYEAYKVNWGRWIIICSNGLKRWEGNNSVWKHTKNVDLSEFIAKTVEDGIGNQKFLEKRIVISKETQLSQEKIFELMGRISLAQASKTRVTDRLAVESQAVGYNEWALSQSLTWLGSHEKAIPLKNQKQLIGLGTDVLEHSLDEVLKEESKIFFDGSYGLVLPKNLRHQ